MDWPSVLTIISVNAALISWLRSDMKSYQDKLDAKFEGYQTKVETKFEGYQSKLDEKFERWFEKWTEETKDFHGRLERIDAEFKSHMCNKPIQCSSFEPSTEKKLKQK